MINYFISVYRKENKDCAVRKGKRQKILYGFFIEFVNRFYTRGWIFVFCLNIFEIYFA